MKRWIKKKVETVLYWLAAWWNSLEEIHEAPAKPHVHSWRRISTFASQCKSKPCGEVRFEEDVPPGFQEYVELMTDKPARSDALSQASIYKAFKAVPGCEEGGTVCGECGRRVPDVGMNGGKFKDCGYCGAQLINE